MSKFSIENTAAYQTKKEELQKLAKKVLELDQQDCKNLEMQMDKVELALYEAFSNQFFNKSSYLKTKIDNH